MVLFLIYVRIKIVLSSYVISRNSCKPKTVDTRVMSIGGKVYVNAIILHCAQFYNESNAT